MIIYILSFSRYCHFLFRKISYLILITTPFFEHLIKGERTKHDAAIVPKNLTSTRCFITYEVKREKKYFDSEFVIVVLAK